jgi:hypothetical protein
MKLCRVYQFDEGLTEALDGLARQANTPSWWHEYGSLIPADFDVYVGLESEATEIVACQPELVFGLLQTPAYADVLARDANPDDMSGDIDKRVRGESADRESPLRSLPPGRRPPPMTARLRCTPSSSATASRLSSPSASPSR